MALGNVQQAQLVVAPISGWRSWRIGEDGRTLVSPQQGDLWPVEGIEAACPYHPKCPASCMSGINCYASAEQLLKSFYRHGPVVGEAHLWGHVRGFELGWRAQHARPVRLWATSRRHAKRVRTICQIYGATYGGVVSQRKAPWQASPEDQRADRRRQLLLTLGLVLVPTATLHLLWPIAGPHQGAGNGQALVYGVLGGMTVQRTFSMIFEQLTGKRAWATNWAVAMMLTVALVTATLGGVSLKRLERAGQPKSVSAQRAVEIVSAHVARDDQPVQTPMRYDSSPVRAWVDSQADDVMSAVPDSEQLRAHLGLDPSTDAQECVVTAKALWCATGTSGALTIQPAVPGLREGERMATVNVAEVAEP